MQISSPKPNDPSPLKLAPLSNRLNFMAPASNENGSKDDPQSLKEPKDGEIYIEETEKTKRMRVIKKKKSNKKCFECSARRPQWGSVSFGIFLCVDCSGSHRRLGPNVSFVRSVGMDDWKEREMTLMEKSGNGRLLRFMSDNCLEVPLDYESSDLVSYKRELRDDITKLFRKPEKTRVTVEDEEEDPEIRGNKSSRKNSNRKTSEAERKRSLVINSNSDEDKSDQGDNGELKNHIEAKTLEEQEERVLVVESKTIRSNVKTRKQRGRKPKGFGGKRIKKFDKDQLVTDDLKIVKTQKIKRRPLFTISKKIETVKVEEAEENIVESKGKGKEKGKARRFKAKREEKEHIENFKNKLEKKNMTNFSGFGSDNLMNQMESPRVETRKKVVQTTVQPGRIY